MINKKFKFPIIVVFLLTTGILLGTQIHKVFSGDNLVENLKKFSNVLTLTQKYYYEDVDSQKLVESAIKGMLEELDPHSVYIPVKEMQAVQEEFRGDFEGVGIEFQVVNDTLTVVSPITGGPSEALGIMSGDRIIKIDDTSCIGISNDNVRKKLRGPSGTKVKVTILRFGVKDSHVYEITRGKIPLFSVDTHLMIDNTTGYVSINRFAENTTDELTSALKDLSNKGMKKLVLDLRNNPGGYLNQAVQIADLFLDGKKKIVYTKGRRKEFDEVYTSETNSPYESMPLVVLINRGSASASEIVSGAIQDWDRGLVIGETSFGKGLVQRQFPLEDGSSVRVTISQYFTPAGRCIQRKYTDKKKYYEDLMERDETEGENITHKSEKDSGRPEYKTGNGRIVYGGGGITPDFIVKSDKITDYTASLLRKNVFYLFVLNYIDVHGKNIQNKYPDLASYRDGFELSKSEIESFIAFAEQKEVKFVEKDFEKEKDYIVSRLKAQIARNYWKNEGWFGVLLGADKQVTKAIALFPKAADMVK